MPNASAVHPGRLPSMKRNAMRISLTGTLNEAPLCSDTMLSYAETGPLISFFPSPIESIKRNTRWPPLNR
jgi:hypothetical protein